MAWRHQLESHKVTSAEAEQVILNGVAVIDYEVVDDEERWLVVGRSNAARFITIPWTFRGDSIRVIMAWDSTNRDRVSRDFVEAAKAGEVRFLTKEQLAERLATRPVTIRLSQADIELAQKHAEAKGLPYQTYIKSLLHETLSERERTGRKRT